MSFDINENKIKKLSNAGKELFLIDSSAFCRFEEVDRISDFSFLTYLKNVSHVHFFVTNEVLMEIANGPRNLNFSFFNDYMLNAEVSFSPNYKENKFIIEENGILKYVELNKISGQDYGQIHLAQNHPELKIVTNDEKFLKSATSLLGEERVRTPFNFLEFIINKDPQNHELKKYRDASLDIFKLKKFKYRKLTK